MSDKEPDDISRRDEPARVKTRWKPLPKKEPPTPGASSVGSGNSKSWNKPRDPNRIPKILSAIEREWQKTPDMRLGQLLVAAVGISSSVPQEEVGRVLFSAEDDYLLEILARSSARRNGQPEENLEIPEGKDEV